LLRGADEPLDVAGRDPHPGLEAGCTHQTPPLLAVGAGGPAMQLEDGCMSYFVAENLV
jgi:hypothetical protein